MAFGVVNLQDTLSGVQLRRTQRPIVSLEKTFTKMQETARTFQDKVKREKALHLVGCSTGALMAEEVDKSTG
jgi:surfactin synthase thioesterase subunit